MRRGAWPFATISCRCTASSASTSAARPACPRVSCGRRWSRRFGTSPPVGRAPEIARTLEQLYREHGYLRATVRPNAIELHDPDRTVLEFDVEAGPQARIGTVAIDGAPAEGREAFLREVHARPSAPYEPPEITAGLAGYVQKLRKRGRYLAAASFRPRPSDAGTVVDLTIELEIGPVVTVAFRGDPLPQDKLAELVPIAREGSVDEDLIEDSIQRIKSYLNQQGYWKADASADRQEGQGTLTIAFTVRRGLHYRIADGVEIVGNRTRSARAVAAGAQPAPGQRRVRRGESRRGRQRHCRAVSAARLRSRESGRRGQRVERPVGHRGPRQAGHHHHGRVAHARGRRDVPGQRRRPGGAAPCRGEIGAGRAVLPAAGRGRLRRGAPGVPQPWICRRQRRRGARAVRGWHARRSDVRNPRGAADDRRPHPDRREHPHRFPGHHARAAAAGGQAPWSRGPHREPAPARRARPVPAHPHRSGVARERRDHGRARDRRGSVHDHGRLRRRPGSQQAPARRTGRRRGGAGPVCAARFLRRRAPEHRREEPFRQPVYAGQPPPEVPVAGRDRAQRLRLQRIPARRHVSRAARVRYQRRSPAHRRGRAGRPVVVQLRAQGRQRGGRPPPVPRDQGQRPLFVRHDPDVRRAARPGRSGADRPHLPAGPPVRVRRRHLPRHARRRARADAGDVPQRGRLPRRARARRPGRFPEDRTCRASGSSVCR